MTISDHLQTFLVYLTYEPFLLCNSSCLYIKTLDTLLKIETIVTLKEALYRCLICLFL